MSIRKSPEKAPSRPEVGGKSGIVSCRPPQDELVKGKSAAPAEARVQIWPSVGVRLASQPTTLLLCVYQIPPFSVQSDLPPNQTHERMSIARTLYISMLSPSKLVFRRMPPDIDPARERRPGVVGGLSRPSR